MEFKSSLLIVLGLMAFVIIVIDLSSDLASQKDEISSVIATLNKLGNPDINIPHTGLNVPVCDDIIIFQNAFLIQTDVIKIHPGRAPPSV